MVAVNQVVDEHVFRYRTEGVEQTRAQADALAKSQAGLAKSSEGVASSGAGAEKSTRSTADAYGKLGAQSEAAAKMAAVLDRAQRQADAAMAQAAVEADALQQSLVGVAEAQAKAAQISTKASEQTVKAANDNTAAAGGYAESLASVVKFAAEHQIATLAIIAGTTKAMGGFAGVASGALGTASEATRRYANENDRLGEKASTAAGKVADGLSTAADVTGKAGEALGALAGRMTPGSAAAGVLVRTLGAIGGFLGPISLLFGAFAVGAAAVERAKADLAKLVALGKDAEKLDVSGPFLKSFTGLGDKLRVEVEGMQAALAQASGLARDRFGQTNAIAKMLADIEAATAPLRASKQFDLAQGSEERIRAVLAAMVELEARGQKLAAIDLGEKVFGAALTDRLRRGEASISKFVADLEDARNKELIRPEDVTRAVALAKEIEDVKLEIDEAMASTLDFSSVAMALNGVWLTVLKTVRDVAVAAAEATRGGDAIVNRQIAGLQARIRSIETVSIPLQIGRGDAAAVESLRLQVVGLRDEADRLSGTFKDVDRRVAEAVGNIEPPLRLASEAMDRLDREAEEAANTIPGLAGALNTVAGSAANAAAKIETVAAGIRALQGLNPNLSGVLGYLDKVRETKAAFDATIAKANADFDKTGDEAAKTKAVTAAMDEQRRTLEALNEQRNKPVQDYVKQGDLSQLKDLDRTLAQNADTYANHRKQVEENYRVLAQAAKTPEDAAQIKAQGDAEVAKLDNARKLLDAKTKADAAASAAKQAGSKGSETDQFDNALQRTKDETEELQRQVEVLGKNRLEYYKMTEANQLWRAARKAGRQDEEGTARAIDEASDAYARQRVQTDRLTDAHQRMQEAFRDGAGEIVDFLDQWILRGGKFADILKSTTSTLASGALRGMLTGEGMMGTLLGLSPTEKGQMGGLFGGKASFGGLDLSDLRKTFRDGFGDGFDNTFGPLLEPGKNASGQSMGFMSSTLGKGLASAGIGASVGYSSGSPLMGALSGGMAGLMTGNPIMGVVGAGAGLIGGLFGQSQAKKEAKKRIEAQLKALREAYEEAKPQIDQLQRQLRGESLGNVGGQIDSAFEQARGANKTASQGGDQARADQIMRDFEAYALRLRETFMMTFEGTLKEVGAGFGTSGPFAQAAAAVATLGESLKAFVKDSESLPDAESNSARARAAAVQAALSAINPPKALSDTQQELARIQGSAAGLDRVLRDLGMSAEEAAAAIRERTGAALQALRGQFESDLGARINEATGKGYLNEVADLVKERDALMADAQAIGAGTGQVSAYFKAAAQKIIDGSELTGDAFDALVRQFPALRGQVVEFGQAIDTAAAKAEAAARRLSYQDRTFAARTDTNTEAGALAAFDRKAAADRLAETKAGGQAMADLEKALAAERVGIIRDFAARAAETEKVAADATARRVLSAEDRLFAARNDASTLTGKLAEIDRQHAQERRDEAEAGGQAILALEEAQNAERLRLIKDFNDQAVQAQKQALEEAQNFVSGATKTIKTYLDGLKAGPETSLSPGDRLREAQSQFDAQLTLARSGDRDALSSITQYAHNLLDAGKGQFSSGKGYQDILAAVTQSLGALPNQISAEQFIVNAIVGQTKDLKEALATGSAAEVAAALKGYFDSLDTNTDGLLSQAEFLLALGPKATIAEQQAALAKFNEIDLNGDGQLTKLETLIAETKGGLAGAKASEVAAALSANFQKLDMNTNGLLSQKEFLTAIGPKATLAEQQAAKTIFASIDENGDGQLTKLELMRSELKAAIQANSPSLIQKALSSEFDKLDGDGSGGLTEAEFLRGLGPLATVAEQTAAKAYFKSIDEDGNGIIDKVELMRGQLKTAVEANSPGAIELALRTNFTKLDTTMNGKLSKAELLAGLGPLATAAQQDAALKVFNAIDADGDGQITKMELIRSQLKAAIEANSPALIQKALALDFAKLDKLDTNTKGALTIAEFKAGLGPLATQAEQDAAELLFKSMDENGDGLLTATELMHGQLKTAIEANSPALINGAIKANFDKLDTTMNGKLTKAELVAGLGPLATVAEQKAAKKVFDEIDLNGDGLLTKTELMRAQLKTAIEANSPSLIQRALSLDFAKLDTNTSASLTEAEFLLGLGPLATLEEQKAATELFEAIDANGDGLITATELMHGQLLTALQKDSPEAMAAAIKTNFPKVDINKDGLLTSKEFLDSLGTLASKKEQQDALTIFKAIDLDGDKQISRLEAMRTSLGSTVVGIKAVTTALNANFSTLNTNGSGGLTLAEFQKAFGPLATAADQKLAEAYFKEIDTNGDKVLTKLELTRTGLLTSLRNNSPASTVKALNDNFKTLDASVNGQLDKAELVAALGPLATKADQDLAKAVFDSIDTNGDDIITKTEAVRADLLAQLKLNDPLAMGAAIAASFEEIDLNTDSKIDWSEFVKAVNPETKAERDALKKVFDSIDKDGNGVITAIESANKAISDAVKANSASAFATALDTNFTKLDTSVNGVLDKDELALAIKNLATTAEQKTATDWIKKLDTNGNGQLTKAELIAGRLLTVGTNTGKTATGTDKTATNTGSTNTSVKEVNATSKLMTAALGAIKGFSKDQKGLLEAVKESTRIQAEQLALLTSQYSIDANSTPDIFGTKLSNNMLTALNKIVFNTANAVIALKSDGKSGQWSFAQGGWVAGPGSSTSDSINARLSNGEFVVNAASARMNAGLLEAMNDNRSIMMPALAMPMSAAAPVANDNGLMLAALRQQIDLLTRTVSILQQQMRLTKDGSDRQVRATADVAEEVAGAREDARRDTAPRRAGRGEPVKGKAA